ncbi:tRNA pseudouridine(55) synthase TruB [Deferribacter thermophilus]|uniref:tRNA pseudouridine(55) synthase TruB n=1 Tax=Deferribacter thermophilus TaxID=53573 RepID=UPI003C287C45
MNFNGFVVLHKEIGVSSFNAVDRLRKILKVKKCGHTGTLDPLAEGVLPVCLNKATKFIKYLDENEKEYIAELKFGIQTDTFDITGTIINKNIEQVVDLAMVQKVLDEMTGDIELPIPKYSAVKINGERAYKLARSDKDFDAGKRVSTIYKVEILDLNYPMCIIKILCSKGTYVRSFINELGIKLGCYATMTNLLRTKSGIFNIKNAYKLDEIEKMFKSKDYSFLLKIEDVLKFPVAVVKDEFLKLAKNGGKLKRGMYLKFPLSSEYNYYFLSDVKGNIFAIAKKLEGSIYPLKVEHVL